MMMGLNGLRGKIKEKIEHKREKSKYLITGKVVVMKKNLRNDGNLTAPVLDRFSELLGHGISFQLISSSQIDPVTGRGKTGKPAYLEKWVTTISSVYTGDSNLKIKFEWDENDGIPGAIIVKNNHPCEFLLKTLTIDDVPGKGKVHFVCNSWVYPVSSYKYDRIFFSNDTYLPSQTPEPLRSYRDLELYHLRGDHVSGPLKEEDRVYDYAVYNDLGDPDTGESNVRPILGASREKPYPRRGRTSRPASKKDPKYESRITGLFGEDNYVPRDERFGYLKMSDFLAFKIKSLGQSLFPALYAIFDRNPGEFNSFEETHDLYKGGFKIPHSKLLEDLREKIPLQLLKELVRKDGSHALRLPLPDLIKEDKFAWRADEEFARQMLAGVNPMVIRRIEEFPPRSKLDPTIYGNQTSTIREEHIEMNMERFTVHEALKDNRLFILDHHDTFMPYLKEINMLKGNFIYATRTLLFLKIDGTLKPLAIELSLPHPDGWALGAVSQVYTPCSYGVEGSIWQLAKAYVAVNDAAHHQLVSHWLNTHAAMEPFVIATNRQLSVMHPIHKLLSPHFRDTMNINALARQALISAGGLFESTVFPGRYALAISSDVYKGWKLTDQGLPQDLFNRGLAIEDHSSPHKLRLLINDYPYAVDGLEIWSAIDSWVNEYCSIYYPDDKVVGIDAELQAWWKEIREVGHGDLKDEKWWPEMQNFEDLTRACTTMIWIASALHAAVNFGQYPYAGYHPSRPTISRRPMPELGTKEYEELKKNSDKVFLKTITSQLHTIVGVSLIEILSRHSSDEVYLGQRDTQEWTSDKRAIDAFNRFSEKLIEIEQKITKMNDDPSLKNRKGPVNMPYMLLYPNTSDRSGKGTGIAGMGIPNSVSI